MPHYSSASSVFLYIVSNRYLVFLTLDFFALHLQEVSIEIRNVVSGLELGLIVSNQSLA